MKKKNKKKRWKHFSTSSIMFSLVFQAFRQFYGLAKIAPLCSTFRPFSNRIALVLPSS